MPSLSTPAPQPNNNPSNNDSGGNAPKWSLGEDRWLVKSCINVSTNPLTVADQKKSSFWTKVAYVYNQNAPNGFAKKASKMLNSLWNWELHWCPSDVDVWRRHIQRKQVGQLMIFKRLRGEKV